MGSNKNSSPRLTLKVSSCFAFPLPLPFRLAVVVGVVGVYVVFGFGSTNRVEKTEDGGGIDIGLVGGRVKPPSSSEEPSEEEASEFPILSSPSLSNSSCSCCSFIFAMVFCLALLLECISGLFKQK